VEAGKYYKKGMSGSVTFAGQSFQASVKEKHQKKEGKDGNPNHQGNSALIYLEILKTTGRL
jgi:hypothetical protein